MANSSGSKGLTRSRRELANEEARLVFHRRLAVSLNPLLFFQQRTPLNLSRFQVFNKRGLLRNKKGLVIDSSPLFNPYFWDSLWLSVTI
ncbi:hypothetical protein N783_20865 [Pontibacillus marinus BH030004 = DSM 16465]|uniref:Uncharacterized protein n=1 Tax=Pontibacillus marinus BH030004 = DSM 16465 TaxID=1385511 RepID=A0A0A5FYF9_9BACI|nr:hypothetical protein N783_20865 [Pontibacillus marinus BH030004 = DSM 16465]